MTAEEQQRSGFSAVQERLNQIVDEVSAEDISLDDALKLYEEAVKLGLSACDLSEQDIEDHLAAEEAAEAPAAGEAVAEAADAGEQVAEVPAPPEQAAAKPGPDSAEAPTA